MLLSINNKLNITLCGMMGSGKSSIGKIIAKKIDFKFLDIDKIIEEKEKKSINDIFNQNGEKYFRIVEEKITIDLLKSKKTILSLGGGAVTNNSIRNCINKNSYNIYLQVNINILKKRLKNSKNRPLIYKENLDYVLNDLFNKREMFYKKADLIIKNEVNIYKTVNDILHKISNE